MTNNESRYNWYEEDFAAFLLSLDLPAYRKNMPIKKSLETEKESFVTKFNEMLTKNRFRGFSNRFYNDLSVQLPLIKKNFDALCQIIDYYDDFKTNVIQIAESFLLIIDRVPSVCAEDFYEIGG